MKLNWGRFVVGFTTVGGGLAAAAYFTPAMVPGGNAQAMNEGWATFAFVAGLIAGFVWSALGPTSKRWSLRSSLRFSS
jgi:hypothetical protein